MEGVARLQVLNAIAAIFSGTNARLQIHQRFSVNEELTVNF
jgi:hypothetical protein